MLKEFVELRANADKAKKAFMHGECTYDQAVAVITEYTDAVNVHAKVTAKHYGVSFKPVSARGFLR